MEVKDYDKDVALAPGSVMAFLVVCRRGCIHSRPGKVLTDLLLDFLEKRSRKNRVTVYYYSC